MPLDSDTFLALGLDLPTPETVNGRSNADVMAAIGHVGDAVYNPCAEATPDPEVPTGKVQKLPEWRDSRIYPETSRDIWLHAAPGAAHGAPVIVFNDGGAYLSRRGAVRATTVLDNLAAAGEITPPVSIFINPGTPLGGLPIPPPTASYAPAATQRAFEYDAMTDRYGRFLLEEILPLAARTLGFELTSEASERTVCGISSGGIAAFNTAWHFPDRFARVISHCGSFTNILGGHNYPYLVRATPRKSLRVYLQSGANDAQTVFGDWPTANQAMAAALDYAGYDYRFDFGSGGHTLRHGGAVFADTLRWLLRAS